MKHVLFFAIASECKAMQSMMLKRSCSNESVFPTVKIKCLILCV